MNNRRIFSVLVVQFVVVAAAIGQIRYPETTRVDQRDEIHGVVVADPYRWLEDDVRVSEKTAAWVKSQNDVTFSWLSEIPEREKITATLRRLYDYPRVSVPVSAGELKMFVKNDGLQNQSVLYAGKSYPDGAEILIDPNTWSKDGTIALSAQRISKSGKWLVYGVAEAGSDWQTYRVLDVDSKKPLADEVRWVKFSGIAFAPDESGFFYSRFDRPEEGSKFQGANLGHKVWFHRIGTSQDDDVLVFFRPENPEWSYQADVSDDGRFLIIEASKGTGKQNLILVRDLRSPYSMPIPVTPAFENAWDFIGNVGTKLYFSTDAGAEKGAVVAIDFTRADGKSRTVVCPETENRLVAATMVANTLVLNYLAHAASNVLVHDLSGKFLRTIELPGIGTAAGFQPVAASNETYYSFSSFATPTSIFRYDFLTGRSTPAFLPKIAADLEKYEVEQHFYESKDGTKIPLFITKKKGIALDAKNPTILYGYGGFDISMTPSFSPVRLAWLEMGGIYAVACLRGGGEYGKSWHDAGTKLKKQNVFDDFIAGAEWLIGKGYTSTPKLAIHGGSNGGLLVGACMTQRPDLFGACLPAVGVLDMLRFENFTAGRFWTYDYGSVKNADEFKALAAYSPYHNLKKGVSYPATLVTTADTDDRVVPAHSFKFAAALQHAQGGASPCLIRIETKAGHGAGKPTAKLIEETADMYAFLWRVLGMENASN